VYSVRFFIGLLASTEKRPGDVIDYVSEPYRVFRRLLADAIRSGIDSGRSRADLDPDLDASILLATLARILIQNIVDSESFPERAMLLLGHLKKTALARLLA
jgi:hypothetical protein